MRVVYTTILSALAASALASPLKGGNQKRDDVVEIVTECTTVLITQYVTADPSPSPTPAGPVQVNDYNVPAAADGYTKYFTFTKSRRPRPSSSSAVEPVPTSVVTPPIETPIPTPTPPTTSSDVVVTTPPPPPASATSSAAPVPTNPTAPAPGGDSFEAQVLSAHNDKRALHGVPPLTYDATMASFAGSVCEPCVFKHSGGPYGENLAAGYSSPAAAIQAWYDENTQYDYPAGQFSSATGHFTQMVWKAATKVGCALKACNGANGTPGSFLTCEYDTGNVIGQFVANVLPPKSQ